MNPRPFSGHSTTQTSEYLKDGKPPRWVENPTSQGMLERRGSYLICRKLGGLDRAVDDLLSNKLLRRMGLGP